MKKILFFAVICILLLTGCSEEKQETDSMFTDRDMEIGYDEETAEKIQLDGNTAISSCEAVEVSESCITITDEGTYLISGTLDNGTIIVDADDTDKLHIVFDDVNITSETFAAMYIRQADKVFVTTAPDSKNYLSSSGEFTAIDDNNVDATMFSKSDLTLNGTGSLTVNSSKGHGIVSKDDLVLTSGTYDITAEKQGISGKDSVRIAQGQYTITSKKDGIHSENSEDETLGFVYIADGDIKVNSVGDGISASLYTQIVDGTYTINAHGESNSSSTQQDSSIKGIKAGKSLIIENGTFNIDSDDDSIHSNGDVNINNGSFEIASGDDGIHADNAVVIDGGKINIAKSYEGIEGLSIDINNGEVNVIADDDGLNAAGGNDSSGFGGFGGDQFRVTEGAYINISGGKVYIDASGDGIDSNGDLSISGGETYVCGPTDGGNGSLDYNGEATISGGVFAAAGSSGMAQNFGENSTQGAIMFTVGSCKSGDTISLKDDNGGELISWQPSKKYESVIVSCPQIKKDDVYTLMAGDFTKDITMDSLIYNAGGGMGNMGGMKAPGGMQTPPDNNKGPAGRDPLGGPGGEPPIQN